MPDRPDSAAQRGAISAELAWKNGDAPFSCRFGDVYFSAEDGLAETRHVFLSGNDLPFAWSGKTDFTIAETGFGTGLNFCAAVLLWLETRPAGGLLHYVSIEGFPLSAEDCCRALERWPELDFVAAAVRQRYPDPVPGMHRIHFEEWGVILTLAIGEAGEMLSSLHGKVDAWFLDGFAPSKNPDMWRDDVLTQVARLTVPKGRLATFTAAGAVRRGLAAQGFDVRKVPGFGRKRDMVIARMQPDVPDNRRPLSHRAAPVRERSRSDRVAIIGGGIAGASLTRALRRRGMTPTVYESEGVGAGASGNRFALVMPRMDAGDSTVARFFAAAYRFAIEQYRGCEAWDPCGLLIMLESDAECKRAEKAQGHAWQPAAEGTLLDQSEASQRAGVELDCPALYFESGGLLRTDTLLNDWLGSTPVVAANVESILRTAQGFRLMAANNETVGEADAVFLAAGEGNHRVAQTAWVPLAPVRGQISSVPPTGLGHNLQCVLSWGGYLTPARDGAHLLGATHDRINKIGADWGRAVVDTDHLHNQRNMPESLATLVPAPDGTWSGRARLRSVTPDRVPVFGSVPYLTDLVDCFCRPAPRGAMTIPEGDLLILGGLGSRGFVTAPLAAEVLIARMLGEVWPLEEHLGIVGDPVRFADRALRHGRIKEFLKVS